MLAQMDVRGVTLPKTEVVKPRPVRPAWKARSRCTAALAVVILALGGGAAHAQQLPDTSWVPPGLVPRWTTGTGPRVVIDGAHHNFHTVDGRYGAFARILRLDGCRVSGSTEKFSAASLRDMEVLVVANPLHPRNESNWSLPTPPAFDVAEVEATREWVRAGGALLLIVDHMPFPGAAASLAAGFGISFRNGFAGAGGELGPITFRPGPVGTGIRGGRLAPHPLVRGAYPGEGVDSLVSFTGSAFRPPEGAEPLLLLPSDTISLEPAQAWQFGKETPRTAVGGWCQGATIRYGRGRVAVFGEAAMFSAQLAGDPPVPMGMNAPAAAQNFRFLLNTVHWLAGELEEENSSRSPANRPFLRRGSPR
jgi:hypothetical protein